VLEPDKAEGHAGRVRDAILDKLEKLRYKGAWRGTVPPCNALFTSIIALDTTYNAIEAKDRTACENMIQAKLKHIGKRGPWILARYGVHGTWQIYKGVRTGPDNPYYRELM
jgi:hypothetical protein